MTVITILMPLSVCLSVCLIFSVRVCADGWRQIKGKVQQTKVHSNVF